MASELIKVSATAQSTATAEAVFAALASGETWPQWTPIKTYALHTPGVDGGESVGAIRQWNSGAMMNLEQIVEMQAPTKFAYTLNESKLVKVKDYRADIVVTPTATGCTVTWNTQFRPKFVGTGWFWKLALSKLGKQLATGVATYAATPAAK
ncbi:unannotated protein [freshwater metagenome]|uniref:Unannotated protein n=1 Tax=freshwater metagenome TaxID=449393 RepID=A0A6J6L925_9ZZZZ|nr:hypothetical protein [Actinomycetota bacterium]MSY38171.1 hypothetical protein [Actinomycetota bacterium]MSZ41883.1 hypothetical protein [Actinomycetota bacterium]